MNLLVLGSGAREHAIAWKLKQSSHDVFIHPGNAGTQKDGFPNLGNAKSIEEISKVAREKNISLVVIGPEVLLAQDYASILRSQGFLVVGPGKEGAQLETSKIFAKEFMVRAGVPTAKFKIFENFNSFRSTLSQSSYPKVLKLDGLAAGKGVVIAKTENQALSFADAVWNQLAFGPLPQRVLEEEFIPGVELSYLGFCDGKTFVPLSSSTDYKRVYDNDEGPNTGGMGAISPSPYMTEELESKIQKTVVAPILHQLHKEDLDFKGVLYIGIMIDKEQNPFVLEFNTRFGDPETQSLMMRIDGDLLPVLMATARGELASAPALHWKREHSIYVVAASPGYPEQPKTGSLISGLAKFSDGEIFFAGVAESPEGLVTAGGRVLGVGALGADLSLAREKAYSSLKNLSWPGIHYRKDIGTVKLS